MRPVPLESDSPEPLSVLEASLLDLEDGDCHLHVGACLVFEAGPLRLSDGGIDIDRIRAAVAAHLHRAPRYRQRVAWPRGARHPCWVDDARFRLAYHVRHTALPRPGDDRTLKRLVGRIMSQALDRQRPLWEMWVVEGLANDRFALVTKTHQAMTDGVSGFDLVTWLLEALPNSDPGEPEPWEPKEEPEDARGAISALWRRFGPSTDPLTVASDIVRDPLGTAEKVANSVAALRELLGARSSGTADTPLQVSVGPHRRVDWLAMPLAELRSVKSIRGGTVNDLVLATVAGALRRFFLRRGVDPDGMEVRALVPVSVRTEEMPRSASEVSGFVIPLPVGEADAVARFEAIEAHAREIEGSGRAIDARTLTAISRWTSPNLLAQAVRFSLGGRPVNLICTNVPGPQIPLYLVGARMIASFPVVPLFRSLGVSIGIFSYDGALHWGFTADWEAFPDLHDLVRDIEDSFDEILDATPGASAPFRLRG